MRRAFLLAALAAPVLATAQQTPTDGQILFSQGDQATDYLRGKWISKSECESSTATVNLSWDTKLVGTGFPADTRYQVYASNKEVPAETNTCYTEDNTSQSITAGPVGTELSGRREVVNFEQFEIAGILDAARPPNRCETTASIPIYVCVQARSGGTVVGIARGLITLSTVRPGKPTEVQAMAADDGALEISWKSPTGDPPALDFNVVAIGPVNTHTATEVRGERFVMSGLENFVTYTINVYAVSEAGNVSDKSDDVTGTPTAVLDWWEWYQLNGGVDDGGCGAGGAGPLAVVGVAALLAALRRRRA